MGKQRTPAEQQVADLLRTARASLHQSVAFLSRLDGTTQTLEIVESSSLPIVFRSYVAAPVVLSDGELYGTFCAFGLAAASVIIEPGVRELHRRSEISDRLAG